MESKMETIKSLVQQYWLEAVDDKKFLDNFNTLVELKGDMAYSAIFKLLADMNIPPSDAKVHWGQFLKHRDMLLAQVQTSINLVAILCDYLTQQEFMFTPKLTDLSSFEDTIQKSTHDELTHLLNRSFFQENLDHQLAQAKRNESSLSLLFIDIDDFKEINDEFGHQAGDTVLCSVAKLLDEEIRQSDFAIRYGGEEFVVVMPETGTVDALILSERIRRSIEEHKYVYKKSKLRLTVSGGVASYPNDANDKEDLIYYADSALYRSKGAGKNCISVFKEDKRRFLRIKLEGPVRVRQMDFNRKEEFSGICKDIGIGGILFENNCSLDLGTELQVSTTISSKDSLVLIGTVVRVELVAPDRYDIGMAMSFKELDKLAKSEITKVLIQQIVEKKCTS
jgi:diguanylate cyclase (GGDEF)-like protein